LFEQARQLGARVTGDQYGTGDGFVGSLLDADGRCFYIRIHEDQVQLNRWDKPILSLNLADGDFWEQFDAAVLALIERAAK
jgi:hypothetical protein